MLKQVSKNLNNNLFKFLSTNGMPIILQISFVISERSSIRHRNSPFFCFFRARRPVFAYILLAPRKWFGWPKTRMVSLEFFALCFIPSVTEIDRPRSCSPFRNVPHFFGICFEASSVKNLSNDTKAGVRGF